MILSSGPQARSRQNSAYSSFRGLFPYFGNRPGLLTLRSPDNTCRPGSVREGRHPKPALGPRPTASLLRSLPAAFRLKVTGNVVTLQGQLRRRSTACALPIPQIPLPGDRVHPAHPHCRAPARRPGTRGLPRIRTLGRLCAGVNGRRPDKTGQGEARFGYLDPRTVRRAGPRPVRRSQADSSMRPGAGWIPVAAHPRARGPRKK